MDKLREAVLISASSNLSAELSSSQIALIDQRLRQSFPRGLRIPSHPTYATMVLKAVTELSEEDGSSEDSISEYIQANYDNLPWAHKSILNHHLDRLCDDGLIVLSASNRYMTPAATSKRGRKKGKYKRKQVTVKQRQVFEKNSGKDLNSCGTEVLDEHELICEENQDSTVFDNPGAIEDENVKKRCMELVVFEEKGDETGQGAQESKMFENEGQAEKENSLITKFSIPDLVKSRTRKTQKKCDQLLTGGTEEETSVDECQEKIRDGDLALQDTSSGEEWKNSSSSLEIMVKKKKETLVDECQEKIRNGDLALQGSSSGEKWKSSSSSLENMVKKKKKDEGDMEEHEVVFAIAKQLPTNTKSGRRVTRQSINSKEQQNKLIASPPSKFPSTELQKEDLTLSRQDSPVDLDIDCPIANKLLKSKESRQRTTIKIKKRDSLEQLWSRSSQEAKSKWPSWIPALLQTKFNGQCEVHANAEKPVCNLYCSDCNSGALCSSCAASHEGHRVIKIRESDFEQSVDISDIGMLDLSGIRTTKESSTKETIVLKRDIASSQNVRANNCCLFCKNRVPFPFKFCTLKCKFQHEVQAG